MTVLAPMMIPPLYETVQSATLSLIFISSCKGIIRVDIDEALSAPVEKIKCCE